MARQDIRTLKSYLDRQKLLTNSGNFDSLSQHILLRKSDQPLLTVDFFTTVYGAKVWDALNNQTRFWNALRKVPWGQTTGWRSRAGRIRTTRAIPDGGDIPDIGKSRFEKIESEPRTIVTPFGVSVKAQFMGNLQGGIGDVLAIEQTNAEVDHLKFINESLVAASHGVVDVSGASGVAIVMPTNFLKPGDRFRVTTSAGAETGTVTYQDTVTGVLTWAGTAGTLVAGNAVSVWGREGVTSLDDIIEQDGRLLPGANAHNVRAYNLTSRAAGTFGAGLVIDNDGVPRALSTSLLDLAIRRVRDAGGEPDLILTGSDQVDKVAQLLNSQQQFTGTDTFRVKVGDELTLPGTNAGFQVATYKGIPLFHDPDVAKTVAANGNVGGSNIYVLDTRSLEIAVAMMTQYAEDRTYRDTLSVNALYYSMIELRALDIGKQVKITDLL